jgi:hypothetical protein
VGFHKLNRLIHTELQRWIVCVGREALASMTDDERVRCGLDLNVGEVLFEIGEDCQTKQRFRKFGKIKLSFLILQS